MLAVALGTGPRTRMSLLVRLMYEDLFPLRPWDLLTRVMFTGSALQWTGEKVIDAIPKEAYVGFFKVQLKKDEEDVPSARAAPRHDVAYGRRMRRFHPAASDHDTCLAKSSEADQLSMQGWVWKQGGLLGRSYQKRWFILQGGNLQYFKSKEVTSLEAARASLSVHGMLVERGAPSAEAAVPGQVSALYCFALTPCDLKENKGHVRRMLCGCASESERDEWCAAIAAAGGLSR